MPCHFLDLKFRFWACVTVLKTFSLVSSKKSNVPYLTCDHHGANFSTHLFSDHHLPATLYTFPSHRRHNYTTLLSMESTIHFQHSIILLMDDTCSHQLPHFSPSGHITSNTSSINLTLYTKEHSPTRINNLRECTHSHPHQTFPEVLFLSQSRAETGRNQVSTLHKAPSLPETFATFHQIIWILTVAFTTYTSHKEWSK